MILLYHRVAPPSCDPWSLCVDPEHFAQHMEVLLGTARVVPLMTYGQERRSGPAEVAVTFDDGYLDVLTAAKPVLEGFDLPATVFVMTAGLAKEHTPWWNALEQALLASEPGDWDASEGPRSEAETRYLESWRRLRDLPCDQRAAELDALLTGTGARHQDSACRLLLADEVAQLAASGLVTVGAHTETHPSLARLSAAEQWRELERSRDALAGALGQPPRCFSYPFGTREHYDATTMRLLTEIGYSLACAGWPGPIDSETPRLELPRHHVPDLDGESFERWLHDRLDDPS
jgi:peptidoglycan/xylan/chitin deacetylase (PgdA/CDA1 family)